MRHELPPDRGAWCLNCNHSWSERMGTRPGKCPRCGHPCTLRAASTPMVRMPDDPYEMETKNDKKA